MSAVIPFDFDGASVRVMTDDAGDPWFVAKEIADVLGYSDAFEMTKKLDDDEKSNRQIAGFGPRGVTLINEAGLYAAILTSQKPEAKRFKKWVTHDVLPSIRRTGGYSAQPAPTAVPASKEFRAVYGVLRLIGCDKQTAAIGANQATVKLTGSNLLALAGQTHLEAANQDTQWFTPTELGKRIDASARKFNLLLAEVGLQAKRGDEWEVLDAGRAFARIYDTGKKHGSGVPVQQIKWSPAVLPLLHREEAA